MIRFAELMDPAAFKVAALASSAASGVASIATVDWTMGVFGVPLSVFLAGFAGALVSLSFLPPPVDGGNRGKTLLSMAGHVFSGTLLAAFAQPLAIFAINRWLAAELPSAVGLGIAGIFGALIMLVLPIGIQYLKKFSGGAQ